MSDEYDVKSEHFLSTSPGKAIQLGEDKIKDEGEKIESALEDLKKEKCIELVVRIRVTNKMFSQGLKYCDWIIWIGHGGDTAEGNDPDLGTFDHTKKNVKPIDWSGGVGVRPGAPPAADRACVYLASCYGQKSASTLNKKYKIPSIGAPGTENSETYIHRALSTANKELSEWKDYCKGCKANTYRKKVCVFIGTRASIVWK